MAPPKKKVDDDVEEELLDYEDEAVAIDADAADAGKAATGGGGDVAKKGYVGIHSTGFRDFLLKPELLRAIVDCGFEHPSEGARDAREMRAARASRGRSRARRAREMRVRRARSQDWMNSVANAGFGSRSARDVRVAPGARARVMRSQMRVRRALSACAR